MWIVPALVLVWMALSFAVSAVTSPIRRYVLISYTRGFWLHKLVPVPCLIAISYLNEHENELMFLDKSAFHWKRKLSRWNERLFAFSLPSRMRYLKISRTCSASHAENALSKDEIHLTNTHPHYRDMTGIGTHRCHDVLGHLPPVHMLKAMLRAMGYENIVDMENGGVLVSRERGENAGLRPLLEVCSSLDEAEAVAVVLRRQVESEMQKIEQTIGLKPGDSRFLTQFMDTDSAIRKSIFSRGHITDVATAFQGYVKNNEDVPLEVLVELFSSETVEADA